MGLKIIFIFYISTGVCHQRLGTAKIIKKLVLRKRKSAEK
jgi:hypothetical protein